MSEGDFKSADCVRNSINYVEDFKRASSNMGERKDDVKRQREW